MDRFSKFLSVNRLKKKDIASFLGVSNAFITQLCSNMRPLPDEKFALIKANTFGWDISMLTTQEDTPEITPDMLKLHKTKGNYEDFLGEACHTTNLIELIMKKDEEIIQLHKRIWELERIIESKGGEDAKNADSSSDAHVG